MQIHALHAPQPPVLPVDMHNQDEVNVCGASGGVDAFARPLGRHTASLDAHGGLGARAGARVGLKGLYAALCEGQFRYILLK